MKVTLPHEVPSLDHLTDYASLQTICKEPWHHDISHIIHYSGLSRLHPHCQAYSPGFNAAIKRTLIRRYDWNRHSRYGTAFPELFYNQYFSIQMLQMEWRIANTICGDDQCPEGTECSAFKHIQ